MSLFRKPKRNVRVRQADSDDENIQNEEQEEENSLDELQKMKDKIKKSSKAKHKNQTSGSNLEKSEEKKAPALLSFDDFGEEADEGEVFRVKKSSQSRKLMKQIRAERKQRERQDLNPEPTPPPLPPGSYNFIQELVRQTKCIENHNIITTVSHRSLIYCLPTSTLF